MEHQNFKLMLHAAGIKETCEEHVATTVRQLDNEKCMIGKCEKCPGTDHAEAHLRNAPALQSDEADGLQVQQWVKGTRCRLEALMLTQEDFRDRLLDMLRQIKVHYFVSKQQARYFRELKTGLEIKNEAIGLLDCAENYSFIVQDAPQSYLWVNDQASIHAVVIYFRPD